MALPRRRVAVCSMARPLELRMLLAVGRVGIVATGPCIDAHEGGLQQAHRKTLPEAGSGYRGKGCRPLSTLTEECGSAWTEAIALAAAQDIAIHVGPSRIVSQAFASSQQASDLSGDTAPLPGLHSRVGVAPSPGRGVGRLLASVQQSPGAS